MEIHEVHYCSVCGSPIWSNTSIERGYGGECAKAIRDAKAERVFKDETLKRQYYSIEAEFIISLFKEKTFKSPFRKSFQDSIVKQATWLSKKQKEIAKQILFDDGQATRSYMETLHHRHESFWDEIPVTREDIEKARRAIRKIKANEGQEE